MTNDLNMNYMHLKNGLSYVKKKSLGILPGSGKIHILTMSADIIDSY